MKRTKALLTCTNYDLMVEASLSERPDGNLIVMVRDLEAGETLPEGRIFKLADKGRAEAYTRRCADMTPEG